jgi:site-specific DNA recombinase
LAVEGGRHYYFGYELIVDFYLTNDARDKKLVINKAEAETVRHIFKRYLELQSFGKLVEDLDKKGIVTKRRNTKVKKFNGGIPFTYGPLAHFLKNRLYVGETGHKDKWFPGEHAATFERAPAPSLMVQPC